MDVVAGCVRPLFRSPQLFSSVLFLLQDPCRTPCGLWASRLPRRRWARTVPRTRADGFEEGWSRRPFILGLPAVATIVGLESGFGEEGPGPSSLLSVASAYLFWGLALVAGWSGVCQNQPLDTFSSLPPILSSGGKPPRCVEELFLGSDGRRAVAQALASPGEPAVWSAPRAAAQVVPTALLDTHRMSSLSSCSRCSLES